MKLLIGLIFLPVSVLSAEIKYSERFGLVETCVLEKTNSLLATADYSALCEYRSKTTKNRSCAMARGEHYAFAVDCSLFDEVNPKK